MIGLFTIAFVLLYNVGYKQSDISNKQLTTNHVFYNLSPDIRIACNEYGIAYYVYRFKPAELLAPVIGRNGLGVTCDEYINDLKNGVISSIK